MAVLDAVAALLDHFVPLRRFQITLHHFPHQFAEIRPRLPAQLLSRFRRIAEKGLHFGGTEVSPSTATTTLPAWSTRLLIDSRPCPGQLDPQFVRGQLNELAHAVLLACSNDKILGLLLLQHQPLHLDIIAGVAPVAKRVKIAKVEANGPTRL